MSHASLLTLDTLDDRREVWHLLHRLSPRRRVSFLAWACERCTGPRGAKPVASHRMAGTIEQAYRCDGADLRLTNEVYGDLLALAANYRFDLGAAAVELERRVKSAGSASSAS